MKFTGERVIPNIPEEKSLWQEHLARYKLAFHLIGENQQVLDLGCGTGYGSTELAQGQGRKVVGLDVSAEAVAYSAAHYSAPSLSFCQANVCALPFPDAHFKAVISFEVIEHLDNPTLYLAQMRRVTKESGFCIISTPDREVYSPNMDKPWNPFHVSEYSMPEFIELLQQTFPWVIIVKQYHFDGYFMNSVYNAEMGKKVYSFQLLTNNETAKAPYMIATCTSNYETYLRLQQLIQLSPAIYGDLGRYGEIVSLRGDVNNLKFHINVLESQIEELKLNLEALNQHLQNVKNGRIMRLLNWVSRFIEKIDNLNEK